MTNGHPIRLAVILAAGLGSRISKRSAIHPKGFISIGGKSLIERSLEILRSSGIQRVLIATGHLSNWYEKLETEWPELKCIKNEAFSTTGSLQSLLTLQKEIQEDFLLLESDLLFEKRAITSLNQLKHEAILLSGETKAGDEVYVEEDREHHLIKVSKNRQEIKHYAGEYVGINRIALETYKTLVGWAKKHPESSKIHYEEGLAAIHPTRKLPLFQIPDLIWTEIDMESQLQRAETTIFPKLKGETL